jgi:hypothetical protein
MKTLCLAIGLGLVGLAAAQNPDVIVRLDTRLSYRTQEIGPTFLRTYDLLGRHSTVSIAFMLEPGFRVRVGQRFQRIPNDPDESLLDEAYVEDEGLWRVGKQYLPFGGWMLRESAVAARADTSLVLEGLPISLAYADAGSGRLSGFVGRIGPARYGLSAAVGKHFGASGTALTLTRRPEDSLGRKRGYRQAFGLDGNQIVGTTYVRGEVLVLRQGHQSGDRDDSIFDLSLEWPNGTGERYLIGATHSTALRRYVYRIGATIEVANNVSFEPMVRARNDRFQDLSLTMRVRF